ncbi:MAG: alanine racemase [Armatimonadetes bacterium]|nr:alanine racemase [Candidatus Hippobium faecium]
MTDRIVAEIDVNQLKKNIDIIKEKVGGRPLFVTVKANAYGHGIIEMSRLFEKFGVDTLCVASFYEAVEIRDENINANILILAPVPCDREIIAEGIRKKISFSVCSYDLAEIINETAGELNAEALVHIKVDTGMSRVGVQPDKAEEFINYVRGLENIKLAGVFTHLAASDDCAENEFTMNQIGIMKRIKENICDESIIFHTANSAAILKYPEAYMDAVRAGIIVYGYLAYPEMADSLAIRPVLKLKSHIIHIKTLPKGVSIGYNRTYITDRETKVATVSAGYGDGYSRALSNRGFVYINGNKVKIIGRVCMDIFMADVTDIDCKLYDDVYLYDWEHKETDIENIAKELDTISYELLTQISARVKREYNN